jgi:hypothetical protein
MMRKEETCCAFLTFEMHDLRDEVWWTITAPENARAVADALFEPFIAAAARAAKTTTDFP